MTSQKTPRAAALFLSAFIDELLLCGVRDVVISPGSRSTPLALIAYESKLRVHVDIDERGAAFFALGLAKASGIPVGVICTSGTAAGNYLPAVLEAESSRVPLIVMTGDRPPRLQNLGAPQTCDQIDLFGRHVRHFQNMPLSSGDAGHVAFARQMALVAFSRAVGSTASTDDYGNTWYGCIGDAGPVHLNFPFEEPLMPDLETEELFTVGRRQGMQTDEAAGESKQSPLNLPVSYLTKETISSVKQLLKTKCTVVLCGEGSCANQAEAQLLLQWAHSYNLLLLADPLSGLRSFTDELVIDNYDNLFSDPDYANIDVVIRFGRYPVSKKCFTCLEKNQPYHIVVDAFETRDFNAMTDLFIRVTPAAFVASFLYDEPEDILAEADEQRQEFVQKWVLGNEEASRRISRVETIDEGFEGTFVYSLMDMIPEFSCLFSASSLSIRMVDTFYLKQNKDLTLLCNRGLNGIDGTVSSALGASLCFEQTTLLIGDLAFLHDVNALALQTEFSSVYGEAAPSVIIIVLNNQGGGIFDLLPQQSSEPYFERLFRTPQSCDLESLCRGFGVSYVCATKVHEFEQAYTGLLADPGIHVIEIALPAEGLREKYAEFLS